MFLSWPRPGRRSTDGLEFSKPDLGQTRLEGTAAAGLANNVIAGLSGATQREGTSVWVDPKRSLGAKYVLVSAGDEWKLNLKQTVKELGLEVAFDCVAGEMTEILVDALPKGGTCYVYGRLSGEAARIAPIDLIYFSKTVEGFLVAGTGSQAWINLSKPVTALWRLNAAGKAVNAGLAGGGWASTKFDDCELDTMHARFLEMWGTSGFTDRKLRIRMPATVEPEL